MVSLKSPLENLRAPLWQPYLLPGLQNWDASSIKHLVTFPSTDVLISPSGLKLLHSWEAIQCDYTLLENKDPIFYFWGSLPEQGVGQAGRKQAFLLHTRTINPLVPLTLTELLQALCYCPHL